jgi:hypothetical protein
MKSMNTEGRWILKKIHTETLPKAPSSRKMHKQVNKRKIDGAAIAHFII